MPQTRAPEPAIVRRLRRVETDEDASRTGARRTASSPLRGWHRVEPLGVVLGVNESEFLRITESVIAYLRVEKALSPLGDRYSASVEHRDIERAAGRRSANLTHATLLLLRSWPLRYDAAGLSAAVHRARRAGEPVLLPGMPVIVSGALETYSAPDSYALVRDERRVRLELSGDIATILTSMTKKALQEVWVVGRLLPGRRPARVRVAAVVA